MALLDVRVETGEAVLVDTSSGTVNGGALVNVNLVLEAGNTVGTPGGLAPAGKVVRLESGSAAET